MTCLNILENNAVANPSKIINYCKLLAEDLLVKYGSVETNNLVSFSII
jgi:hypothetical protein